ncbi:hypothetical protein ES703_52110 [subsurface metagenome]
MAKLSAMPEQAIIDGFKGTIDFYLWRGIPCVRMWPRKADPRGIPEVEAHWASFSYVSKLWSLLSPEIKAAYNSQASDGGLSGRDLMTRGFLSGIYTYSH